MVLVSNVDEKWGKQKVNCGRVPFARDANLWRENGAFRDIC